MAGLCGLLTGGAYFLSPSLVLSLSSLSSPPPPFFFHLFAQSPSVRPLPPSRARHCCPFNTFHSALRPNLDTCVRAVPAFKINFDSGTIATVQIEKVNTRRGNLFICPRKGHEEAKLVEKRRPILWLQEESGRLSVCLRTESGLRCRFLSGKANLGRLENNLVMAVGGCWEWEACG